jgi:hypothetical protein|tara:strand:+ start:305 stop:622 length:318 start_codon:yes stop_codon:yes gene_type:complete
MVYGTVRVGPVGQATLVDGRGFTVEDGFFNDPSSVVYVVFDEPFESIPHIILQRNSNSANHYQWKPGAYNANETQFTIALTYRDYDGPSGIWSSGSVGVSFIAIG